MNLEHISNTIPRGLKYLWGELCHGFSGRICLRGVGKADVVQWESLALFLSTAGKVLLKSYLL